MHESFTKIQNLEQREIINSNPQIQLNYVSLGFYECGLTALLSFINYTKIMTHREKKSWQQ